MRALLRDLPGTSGEVRASFARVSASPTMMTAMGERDGIAKRLMLLGAAVVLGGGAWWMFGEETRYDNTGPFNTGPVTSETVHPDSGLVVALVGALILVIGVVRYTRNRSA